MDLRRQKSAGQYPLRRRGGEKSGSNTRNKDPREDVSGSPLRSTGRQGASQQKKFGIFQSQAAQRMGTSSDRDAQSRIEARHEELKRQIAMKERQLAEMTRNEPSGNRLRNRLQDQHKQQFTSGKSIMSEERSRGQGSRSPVSIKQQKPGGLRSTFTTRPQATSQIRPPQQNNFTNDTRDFQFNPTRQPRNVQASPLRRSHGRTSNSRSKDGRYENGSRSKSNRGSHSPYQSQGRSPFQQTQQPMFTSSMYGTRQQPTPTMSNQPHNYEYNSSPLRNSKSRSPPSKVLPQRIEERPQPSVAPQMHFGQNGEEDYVHDLMKYKGSLYQNRIQAMEVDNEQMQRRLQQVSLELQRVKTEREELSNQLTSVQQQNQIVEEKTLIKDEVDMQNKVLTNDLEHQRDENDRLSRQLKEEQMDTNNTNVRLVNTSHASKNLHHESNSLNSNMQQILRRLDEVSRDKLHNSKELNLVNSELERLSKEDLGVCHSNIDLESQIQKLISEKQQIHRNLESLTKQYDECVREITQARRNMDAGNDWQTKLIVTKIIVQNLESFKAARKTMAYKELSSYSLFDKDCQQKLRSFSVVAMKLGHYKMKKGLDAWYDNCLKPLDTHFQNDDLAEKFGNDKIKARVFHAWQKYKQMKFDKYYVKNNSIERIWHLLNRGAKQEQKRALAIWKERQSFDKHKLRKIRAVLRKRNNNNLTIALNFWRGYSNVLGHHCRVHILHREFTQKVFLSQVFSQMKFVLRNDKRRRIRCLNQYVKAWSEYCRYNRHLMQANMASIQFCQANSKYLMKNVFDALRVHCEEKKYAILHQAVQEDINVAIKETDEFVLQKSEVVLRKNRNRAGIIVTAMLGKRLFAYFDQWRSVNKHYQRTMVSKINDRLIKLYTNEMSSYFQRWKDQVLKKQRQKRQKVVMDMQIQNESFQNEALSNDKTLRFHSEKVSSIKRRLVDKTFRKLFYRKLAVALGRWKDTCNFRGSREERVKRVLIRGKRRKLKQAFGLYIHFFRRSQQHGRNVRGASYMLDTLHQRTMRKIYNSLCFHTNRQVTAKKYWTRIFTRMDHFMKKRAIKIWNENGHTKFQGQLSSKQDELMSHIEAKNAAICQFESFKLQQGGDIDMATLNRRRKAYRLIGNFFVRCYTDMTTQKFRAWKENVSVQIHKEKIIMRTLAHWRKSQLEQARHIFKKFNFGYSMQEKTDKMKVTVQEANLIRTKIQFEKEQAAKNYKEQSAVAQASFVAGDALEQKYVHIMSVLERRTVDWQYASKKRFIFWSWRHAVKQQKAFLLCVKTVLEKSMWTKGLEVIKEHAKNVHYERQVHRMLRRFSARYYKINCNDSFTKWKMNQLSKVDNKKSEALQAVTEESAEFEGYVQKAKEQNTARCLKFFVDTQKINIWRAWVNVIKQLKLTKAKTVEFQTQQLMLKKEAGVRRWKARYEKTKVCRARCKQLNRQFQFKYRRSAFVWLKNHYKQTKNFITVLSNLERLFREKMLADSFKTTKSFAVSKGLVQGNRRGKGTEDLMSLVQQAYLKRLGANFQRYKQNCFKNAERDGKLKKVYNKFCTARARDAFEWWKRKAELAQLVIDNHEAGPVRAEHWEAEREIANLKEFMRSEHFTEDEIEKQFNDLSTQNEHLMKKYLLRMKHFSENDNKLLPIVWNRWREYVGIRKLVKYQFRMMANQTHNVKADLQRAFKKWRAGPDQLAKELWQLPLETLQDLGMKTTQQVENCGDQLEENQAVQNHLLIQRDEFLNFYVKSQVLAMALIKDRGEFAKMQSWSRWNWARRCLNRNDLNQAIRDAAYIHANLKAKESKLDAENKQLEGENKDLGQFTEDGKVIKANFDKTKAERDKIAAQIADTDDDYNELLEENERLKAQIGEIEEKLKTYKNPKFQDLKSMKAAPKKEEPADPEMTEAQKKEEERFRKLSKLSQGASLR